MVAVARNKRPKASAMAIRSAKATSRRPPSPQQATGGASTVEMTEKVRARGGVNHPASLSNRRDTRESAAAFKKRLRILIRQRKLVIALSASTGSRAGNQTALEE